MLPIKMSDITTKVPVLYMTYTYYNSRTSFIALFISIALTVGTYTEWL